MGRAIVIVTDGAGTEFIGACEYVEGNPVLDAAGYVALYDPLRLTVASDGSNFRSIMTPPGSFDWTSKRRVKPEGIEEAGPIAAARYRTNVEAYKKEYDKQIAGEQKVRTPKLIVMGENK